MPKPIVYMIDGDASVLESLRCLLESVNLEVETHKSTDTFLESYNPARPGCLLLDIRLPGMSGLDLQDYLKRSEKILPIIMITAYGDVSVAVRALKAGAFDFIEKPYKDQDILDAVRNALNLDMDQRKRRSISCEIKQRVASLTPRELEIMELVVNGKPTRLIASDLQISPKTVESHRARIMRKMQAGSIAQLVRDAINLDEGVVHFND